MYPHVTQFETRRQDLERSLASSKRHHTGREAPVARPSAAPPRYKLALVTWVGAYMLITVLLALLGPAIASWPLALRTLVLSVTMVAALTWVVMPRLTRLFRPWLSAGA
jgi:antibiotic biosynthesis monooxygenase (ABM) superfamily enzyme